MSVATQALRYGWKALAILTLGGVTIFTADTTMRRITTETVIQIVLGVHERCLATQYSTNPVSYYVSPPEFVRSMISTNGAGGWETNSMTNTIDWRMDRAVMIALDAVITNLIPFYVNTNTVCDGTTNIAMLTVTGLWVQLQIGDYGMHVTTNTNTFVVSTNWGTDFTAIPAIGTNAAIYGPWTWRNYVTPWQERYKVLNALKVTFPDLSGISTGRYDVPAAFEYGSWSNAKTHSELNFTNGVSWRETEFQCFTAGFLYTNNYTYMSWIRTFRLSAPGLASALNSNVPHNIWFFLKPTLPEMPGTLTKTNGAVFDDNELGLILNTWSIVTDYPFGLPEGTAPTWCEEPTVNSAPGWYFGPEYTGFMELRGFIIKEENQKNIVNWQFNYCTNHFW